MKKAVLLCLLIALSVMADQRDEQLFAEWSRDQDLVGFQQFLRSRNIDSVVPIHQLLRTASDWQKCNAAPFAVPPANHWPAVEATLKLLQVLKAEGILTHFEVVSAYRDPVLNSCAEGSAHSSHMQAFAVDLEFPEASQDADRLCEFWKKDGGKWNMGLSRYPSGRVHIDTSGYRTWGEDYSFRTSYCLW
jgi:hypothetical protein